MIVHRVVERRSPVDGDRIRLRARLQKKLANRPGFPVDRVIPASTLTGFDARKPPRIPCRPRGEGAKDRICLGRRRRRRRRLTLELTRDTAPDL